VEKNQIDFVWFMSLYYEPVEVPFATTVWDLGHRQMPWFPELSLSGWTFEMREQHFQRVLPRASVIAVGNSVGARDIERYYRVDAQNICQIPLPVDAQGLRAIGRDAQALAAFGVVPGGYLLYPAQFWPHKNHITLVDMLAELHAAGRSLKLVFSGSDKGNREYVEGHVARRGLSGSVVFAGFLESAALYQLYRHAFAMVFGSVMGPDNLPPLEAMALDCPVVCAAFDGAREQLGEAALLFEPLDSQAAARAVLQLEDPGTRGRLVTLGQQVVASRSPGDYIGKINEVLDRFAARRRLWEAGNSYRHPA
jgi:glycosyltransferase involved in cell wall biosynthesis